jgi:hypothetical protein
MSEIMRMIKMAEKIKLSKLNKKGIFYSLSVILFLLFLIIFFNTKAEIQKKENQFHIDRAQIIVMDHFVRDFDQYYTKEILEAAAKPALIEMTRDSPFSRADLVDIMMDGTHGSINMNPLLATNDNFQQALGTLTFNLDKKEFDYSLESVEQVDFDTIKLSFLVDYWFYAFDTNWSKKNKPVSITLSVYSLWHPTYSAQYGVIDTSWVQDWKATKCYAEQIFESVTILSCGNKENIIPPCTRKCLAGECGNYVNCTSAFGGCSQGDSCCRGQCIAI